MVIPAPASRIDAPGSVTLRTISGEPTVAAYLSEVLGLPVVDRGDLSLVLGVSPGPGGYSLEVTDNGARIEADAPAGLFAGAQTLLQLESRGTIGHVRIEDHPRFRYRGAMLDIARHFFGVDEIKRYIDDIALLKLNHLHLHLTDDQGWRIAIDSWPRLTEVGGLTQVGGGGGGFLSKDDYREIVRYAASRFITVVPEVDLPGHTNAAIVAYPELGDASAQPYEGIEVGFSSLAIRSESTYRFVDDVVRELAELTPGPYLHIGGDESLATTDEDFRYFVERASAIVAAHGKTAIGWHEMGRSPHLPPGTVGQYWSFTTPQPGAAEQSQSFLDAGGLLIMSPADVAYLDIKYDPHSPLGLVWAEGPTTVPQSYAWDPAQILPGVDDEQLLGVEAPIWSETLRTIDDVEAMAFPRLACIAEIAWSPREGRSWESFAPRVAEFGRILDARGIRYHRAPEVSWRQ